MEEETLRLHATHLAREGGWLQILRKIVLAALCQMLWSKISSDVSRCGVKRGWRHLSCCSDSARERALSFCNPWFLNIDSFNVSRETEDAFFFCLQLLLLFFFFKLFGILKIRRHTFCYLSTQLCETDQVFFTVPGIELGADYFFIYMRENPPREPRL